MLVWAEDVPIIENNALNMYNVVNDQSPSGADTGFCKGGGGGPGVEY